MAECEIFPVYFHWFFVDMVTT